MLNQEMAFRQLQLPKHAGWGGRRKGAGRKPGGKRAGVSHARRARLARRFPVHVTLRVLPHVWNLRSRRAFQVVRRALAGGGARLGIRFCEFSVQGNHMHFVVEAEDERALSRGMQGFGIRIAKGLNHMMRRTGKVLADRFHARILRTPTEVARVLRYVRNNRAVHWARWVKANVTPPRSGTDLHGQPPARHERQGTGPPIHLRRIGSTAMEASSERAQRPADLDLYSSAAPSHGIPLPIAHTYLLLRAQAENASEAEKEH